MISQDDRSFFTFQKQRLEQARKNGDTEGYHRVYSTMLSQANKVIADQCWWEIWAKDEACGILRDVLAIPPYLATPTLGQVNQNLAVHRTIDKTLKEETASLERTKLVVEIIDSAATVAGIVIGVGSATVVARELINRVGLRKAGELLAKELIKNQIRQDLQDKAIDGLAEALQTDSATAHMAVNLAQAVRDARRARIPHTAEPTRQVPVKPRPELTNLNATLASLKQEETRVQNAALQPLASSAQVATRPAIRKSVKDALGSLAEGQERRHFVPWKYMRDMTDAAVTETNWKRIAERFGYDITKFKDAVQFKRKWQLAARGESRE